LTRFRNPEEIDALILGACDASLTEAEAHSLFDDATRDAEVRNALVRQVLMDRLLSATLARPMNPDVVLGSLASREGPTLSEQTLATLRTREADVQRTRGETPTVRNDAKHRVRRRWVTPLVALSSAAAFTLVAFQSIRDRQSPQPIALHTESFDAAPVQKGMSGKTALTNSMFPIVDGDQKQLQGLVRGRVISPANLANLDARKSGWEVGEAAECPPGSGARICLKSARMGHPKHQNQFGVTWGNWRDVLFQQDKTLFIGFDYWVGDTTSTRPQITLAIHGDDGRTYRLDFATEGKAKWAHVVAPLRLARYWHDPALTLTPGENVRALHFTIDWGDDDVFFLANIEIVGYSPL
jgi:hypothetical protein